MEINTKNFIMYDNEQLNKAAKGIIESVDGLPVNEALALLKLIMDEIKYMSQACNVINVVERK